jgi:hypothetical protein
MPEKRRHERVPFDGPAYIDLNPRLTLRARATDISCSGIGLLSAEPFSPGDALLLRVPLTRDMRSDEAQLNGKVRHSRPNHYRFRLGIEFIDVDTDTHNRIRKLIVFRGGPGMDMLAHPCAREIDGILLLPRGGATRGGPPREDSLRR